jgi:type VI secretion system secreted protein VgrG
MSVCDAELRIERDRVKYRIDCINISASIGLPAQIGCELDLGEPMSEVSFFASDTLGKRCHIALVRGDTKREFSGRISSVQLGRTSARLLVKGPLAPLDGGPKCRAFANKTINEILECILSNLDRHQLPQSESTQTIPFFAQYNESDLRFLTRLAALEGYLIREEGDCVCVERHSANSVIALEWSDLLDDRETLSLSPLPTNRTIVSSEYDPHEVARLYPVTSRDLDFEYADTIKSAAGVLFPDSSQVYHCSCFEGQKDRSNAVARQISSGSVTYRLLTDHPGVRVGSVISCPSGHMFRNRLFVSGIRAEWQRGAYRCEVEAVPESIASVASADHCANALTHGMATAMVVDDKDPLQLGRVKIRFPWAEADTWARVLSVSAGANGGAAWTPTAKDEVLCGFELGSPSHPIVLGCLYHSEAKPSFLTDNGVDEVLIARTKGGTEVRVIDTSGKEELFVVMRNNTNELRLTLGNGGQILLQTKGDLRLAGKTACVSATGELKLEADEITISAKKEVKIVGKTIRLN